MTAPDIKFTDRDEWRVNQVYEPKTQTLVCGYCGTDKFIVGQGHCFTAIKCPNCGWEECIHDG